MGAQPIGIQFTNTSIVMWRKRKRKKESAQESVALLSPLHSHNAIHRHIYNLRTSPRRAVISSHCRPRLHSQATTPQGDNMSIEHTHRFGFRFYTRACTCDHPYPNIKYSCMAHMAFAITNRIFSLLSLYILSFNIRDAATLRCKFK